VGGDLKNLATHTNFFLSTAMRSALGSMPFLSPSAIHLPQRHRIAYNKDISFPFIREEYEDGK
jgi:hypothetical protein